MPHTDDIRVVHSLRRLTVDAGIICFILFLYGHSTLVKGWWSTVSYSHAPQRDVFLLLPACLANQLYFAVILKISPRRACE